MKKTLMLLALLLAICNISGCAMARGECVYLSGDIECEVSWELGGRGYRATVERRDGYTRIRFSEPPSLCGVTLIRDGENRSASLDGIEIEGYAAERLFEIERFFEYDTKILSSTLDGEVELLTLRPPVGEDFLLCREDGIPSFIEGELFGERRRITLISVRGDMLGEMK